MSVYPVPAPDFKSNYLFLFSLYERERPRRFIATAKNDRIFLFGNDDDDDNDDDNDDDDCNDDRTDNDIGDDSDDDCVAAAFE